MDTRPKAEPEPTLIERIEQAEAFFNERRGGGETRRESGVLRARFGSHPNAALSGFRREAFLTIRPLPMNIRTGPLTRADVTGS